MVNEEQIAEILVAAYLEELQEWEQLKDDYELAMLGL